MGHFIVEGISTRVKSPMKIHGRFYSGKILAHRMPYFSVLGILKYGIGWRPQNAAFENCSIWELLHLRNARFENCSIWEMLNLRNAGFENCYIWELLYLRNARFEKRRIWETWGWRQILHFEKAAISIKKVNSILSKQWLVEKSAMCLETLKELNMIGIQD